jgi:hypothetical protein
MSDDERRRTRIRIAAVAGAIAIAAALVIAFARTFGGVPGTESLAGELTDRGLVVVVGGADLASVARGRTRTKLASELPSVARALEGTDARALARALSEASVDALLVDGRAPAAERDDAPLSERLGRYEHVLGLRARLVAPSAAVYAVDDFQGLSEAEERALAHVARRILAGDRPPRIASFPESLRAVENVEVMVLLREDGQPRLWRSARGSSFARALLTAAIVARQRWEERQATMGGPIEDVLPRLSVEVVRLAEDGTLATRSQSFVDRVFTKEHGVAFEHRGSWHYLLPEATAERGEGSASAAYRGLFTDNGFTEDAMEREDLRLYRLVATPLAVSPPTSSSDDVPLPPLPLPPPDPDAVAPDPSAPDGDDGAL